MPSARSMSPGLSAVASLKRAPEATRNSTSGCQCSVTQECSRANSSWVRNTISDGASRRIRLPLQGLAERCLARTAALRAPARKPCLLAAVLAEPGRLLSQAATSWLVRALSGSGPIRDGAMSLAT